MADLMDEALQAVQEFENSDDDDLFRELGLRVKAIERDPKVGEHFAPPRSMLEPKGIALGDVLDVGRRYFATISKTGYGVICSGGMPQGTHFDSLMTSLGTNRMAITAGLATLLATSIGIPAAIAGVVAALAIGKAAPASLQAVCTGWAAKAGYAAAGTSSPTPPAAPLP